MWADSDDRAVVLPDAIEERGQQLAPLGGIGLDLPEAGEVVEQFGRLVEARVGRWSEALQLLFEGLALEDVAVAGEVAEDVEVLEAFELAGQLAAASGVIAVGRSGLRGDRVERGGLELGVRPEVGQPGDELLLQRLGLADRLAALAAVAAGRALVAADAAAAAAGAVHALAAALAVQQLAQHVAR
ncbi:hypothetical protein [Patulibacter medicamentivorans]|uniref:hypothetical protein n=1 Tax=Patulibacter medicamentivorans TaxID=1097667 RepID=UPI00058B1A15|nr:hypothetical protein [Patulibacter medicamentivorans]